jgi:endoglucanase
MIDVNGNRVKLAGVNWYGADNKEFSVGGLAYRPLAAIAHQVKAMGFNSVRIPWSNELVETNPVVPYYAIVANPALKGKRALEVLDLTIDVLAGEGVYVILDNHVSRADGALIRRRQRTLAQPCVSGRTLARGLAFYGTALQESTGRHRRGRAQ